MIFFVFERRMKLEGREREGRLWSWVIFFVFNDGRAGFEFEDLGNFVSKVFNRVCLRLN